MKNASYNRAYLEETFVVLRLLVASFPLFLATFYAAILLFVAVLLFVIL